MTLNAFELDGNKTKVETWHFHTQTKMRVKLNLTNFTSNCIFLPEPSIIKSEQFQLKFLPEPSHLHLFLRFPARFHAPL